VCDDSTLIAGAVEECLRFESPAQFIARTALARLELHGKTIREGETVLLLLGSANRDASAFADPGRFDMRRTPNPHLSFGRGRHACLGGGLATAQVHAAIAAFARELPSLTLVPAPTRWLPRVGHRWLAELRVATRPPA
jgi:pimeloyl-[acyl-carrier protein] synthase